MKYRTLLIGWTIVGVGLARGAETPTAPPPDLGKDVLPIFVNKCQQCHGGIHQKNGLDLRSHTSILKGGQSGPAVKPGAPDASLLWQRVAADQMPKTNLKLTAEEKAILRAWIAGGARPPAGASLAPVAKGAGPRAPAAVAADIDREINAQLAEAKLPPSPRAADGEFLRRAYLDIIGRVPRFEEATAFLDSQDAGKRARLIDDLLARPEYGRHFAEVWINIFNVYRINEQRKPRDPVVRDWLAAKLNENHGWDRIVHALLASEAPKNTKDNPPEVQYFLYTADGMGKLDTATTTSVTAQVFLGLGLHCAECHDHPFQEWKQTDFWGMAAFFGGLGGPGVVSTGLSDAPVEVKGGKPPTSVIIPIYSEEAENRGTKVVARFPGGATPALDPTRIRRRATFADWLIAPDNPYFARTYTNRIWGQFFGRGFVAEFTDFSPTSPPSHPALLRMLSAELIASRFDHKHLIRCICGSEAYQRSGRPLPENKADDQRYSRMTAKVLSPEVLYDSLCTVLEVPQINLPNPPKASKALPPPDPREQFARFFRGMVATEDPTEYGTGVPQVLRLMNQADFNGGGKLVERLHQLDGRPEALIENLVLAAYARRPTAVERQELTQFVRAHPRPQEAAHRVLWALLNSSEFMLNR